jgi:hypothetical protein
MSEKEIFTFYNAFVDAECASCHKKIRVPIKICFEHEIVEEGFYQCFCQYSKKAIDEFYRQKGNLECDEFKNNQDEK